MRIALSPGSDLASPVSRVLLADERVEALGVPHPSANEPKTVPLTGFTADAVVSFDPDHPYVTAAIEASTPVVSIDGSAATLRGGLMVLALAIANQFEPDTVSLVAWTEPGAPVRTGRTVSFPQPLGAALGAEAEAGIRVPVSGSWAGALVERTDGSSISVVDDRRFLTSICVAARTVTVASGDLTLGSRLLEEASRAGAEFAAATR